MEVTDMESSQKQPFHLSEHCYSKQCADGSEAMDTDQSTPVLVSTTLDEHSDLTKLKDGQDTFETILLLLLQTFTSYQRKSSPDRANVLTDMDVSNNLPVADIGRGPPVKLDISAEALNALSSEQVMALVTSNSVNYEVIQQIIARKQKRGGDSEMDVGGGKSQENKTNNGNSTIKVSSEKDDSSSGPSSLLPNISQQLLQVTPEQLQQLQVHITELLRQQKVTLPSDLSMEQQLELIQSLLVQQLNNPSSNSEVKDVVEPGPSHGGSRDTKTKSTPPPATSSQASSSTSTVVTLQNKPHSKPPSTRAGSALSGLPTGTQRKKKEPARKEPKKPPKPYNIFFSEVYSTVMAANPKMSLPEASKIISTMWNAMGDDVKTRYKEECERLQQEYQITMQQYQASKPEPTETQSTLQLLLTKSSLNPHSVGSTVKADVKQGPVVVSPTSPVVAMTPTTLMSSAVSSKTEATALKTEPALLVAESSSSQVNTAVINMEKNPLTFTMTSTGSKTCVNIGCTNVAVFSEDRGPLYCSSDCVVKHCRSAFDTWVSIRKIKA